MIHFIRFNVVGLFGFALQSSTLFILTHGAHPVGYLAATAAAVELAILNNFIWHQRWTWRDRPSATTVETLRRLAKFNVTNGAVSIIGNLVLMSILVGRLRLPIAGANVASVAACSICNFFLADRIAFYVSNGSKIAKSRQAQGSRLAAATKARARQSR
jgi:dolichol-phosphate mannosyltransferase